MPQALLFLAWLLTWAALRWLRLVLLVGTLGRRSAACATQAPLPETTLLSPSSCCCPMFTLDLCK